MFPLSNQILKFVTKYIYNPTCGNDSIVDATLIFIFFNYELEIHAFEATDATSIVWAYMYFV